MFTTKDLSSMLMGLLRLNFMSKEKTQGLHSTLKDPFEQDLILRKPFKIDSTLRWSFDHDPKCL